MHPKEGVTEMGMCDETGAVVVQRSVPSSELLVWGFRVLVSYRGNLLESHRVELVGRLPEKEVQLVHEPWSGHSCACSEEGWQCVNVVGKVVVMKMSRQGMTSLLPLRTEWASA